jgi:2,4-diketo-3-deoxy-L-fuconate hydrolase
MHFGNIGGRAAIVRGDDAYDLGLASSGTLPSDPMEALAVWSAVTAWAASAEPVEAGLIAGATTWGPPVPRPRQSIGIAVNYRTHAEETDNSALDVPQAFTKFPSCITGPTSDVVIPSGDIDWEVEIVVVIGREGTDISSDDAWDHVAGITCGQDISNRTLQRIGLRQMSLAKSHRTFGSTGPTIVTVDELRDRDDIRLSCTVNGFERQSGSSRDMIFSIPELISYLSTILTLYPGDLIFTGTPSGVGARLTPPQYLHAGDVIITWVEGVGEMVNNCVADSIGA